MSSHPGIKLKSTELVPDQPSFFCYIVRCADGSFYTGWSTDPHRREKCHNSGRGARYTSTRRPVTLVYIEPQPDRSSAMKREASIKSMTRLRKQKLIEQGKGKPENA
jgi:putative endonuclease